MRWLFVITLALITEAVVAQGLPSLSRQAELRYLLLHDCGSCHGLTRRGGLGPALTPQALRGKSEAYLRAVILNGRPGTPMPPWRGQLSAGDVAWLAKYLLSCPSGAQTGAKGFDCRPTPNRGQLER